MLNHRTKKLFYGKWPYKIATWIKEGNTLRPLTPPNVSHYLKFDKNLSADERDKLIDFCNRYSKFYNENYKVRHEGSHVNFFIADKHLFNKIKSTMDIFITDTWEPENDTVLNALLDNKKLVVVDDLPHNRYTSKIILRKMPHNKRENFVKLLKKYTVGQILMSSCTEDYLLGKRLYMQDPFIYIEDDKMLTMLALAADGYIKKTEKFVLKSSINTCLEQEQPCHHSVKA